MLKIMFLVIGYLHLAHVSCDKCVSDRKDDDVVSALQRSVSVHSRNANRTASLGQVSVSTNLTSPLASHINPSGAKNIADSGRLQELSGGSASLNTELDRGWKWSPFKKGKPDVVCLIIFAVVAVLVVVICCLLLSDPEVQASGKSNYKHSLLAGGFGFCCGWVDAICLIRYQAFATMMTGNMFQLGYTMIYPKMLDRTDLQDIKYVRLPDPLFYSLVTLAYCFGIVVYRSAEYRLGRRTATIVGPILAIGIAVYDVVDTFTKNPIFGNPRWVVCFLAPAFGVVNTLSTKGGLGTNTAFLSGHLQEVMLTLTAVMHGESIREKKSKLAMQLTIILCIVVGALAAAGADRLFGGKKEGASDLALVVVAPIIAFLFIMHDRLFYAESAPADATPATRA